VIIEDLFPTILDAASVNWRKKTIQTVDGVSFVPALTGQERRLPDHALNRPLIFHFPHQYYGQGPFSAIRLGPWKLIHHHAEGKMELYNIDRDISESNDLSLKERAVTIRLARILAARLRAEKAMMPVVRQTGRPVTISTFIPHA
jgi:arylsulfatase A-like enzyme